MRALARMLIISLAILATLDSLNACAGLVQRLNSDSLCAAGLFDDFFVKGYSISAEAYNDHPGFFPDSAVYWLLLALLPLGPATALYAIIWLLCLLTLTYMLLRRVGAGRELALLGALCATTWQISIIRRIALDVLYPHYHGAAILIGLILILAVERASRTGKQALWAGMLVAPTIASVVSDKITIPHVLAPLCLTFLILYSRRKTLGAYLWIGFCVLSSGLGLVMIQSFRYLGLGRFNNNFTVRKLDWILDFTVLRVMGVLCIDFPIIGLSLAAWLIVSLHTFFRVRSAEAENKKNLVLFHTLLISMALGTFGGVMTTGIFLNLGSVRYIFPLLLLGPTAVVLSLACSERRRQAFVIGLATVILLVNIPTMAVHFERKDFQTPYPRDVERLDTITRELGITRGYAQYWRARRASLFSRNNLAIVPVDNSLLPYKLSANLDSFHPPGDVEFILSHRLNPELLKRFYGNPSSVKKLVTTEVLIIDPKQTIFTDPGSLIHIGMMQLAGKSIRQRDLSIESPRSVDRSLVMDGPRIVLAPGNYRVTCTMEFDGDVGGINCEVILQDKKLAREEKLLSDFHPTGKASLTFPFTVSKSMVADRFRFRVGKTGAYRLHITAISLHRVE